LKIEVHRRDIGVMMKNKEERGKRGKKVLKEHDGSI